MSNATGRLGDDDGGDGTRSSIGDSPTLIGLNIQWSSFSLSSLVVIMESGKNPRPPKVNISVHLATRSVLLISMSLGQEQEPSTSADYSRADLA